MNTVVQTLGLGGTIAVGSVMGLVALLLLGGVGVGGVSLVRKIRAARAAKAGVPNTTPAMPATLFPNLAGRLGDLNNSPLAHEALAVLFQAVHASQHAALNMAVAKAFPALAPFIPMIDKGADAVEGAIAGKLGVQQSTPQVVSITAPADHPIIGFLKSSLEAHLKQMAAVQNNKAA